MNRIALKILLTLSYEHRPLFIVVILYLHVITKTTRSIMVTVLEQALTAIYAVLSVNVKINYYETKLYVDSQKG